ncbi:hypothetical protein [Actinomadura sp. B10D3]|uniref:hypothetical protein n=1 Tax=Actinomadura sp. B10D3 TaxID=3153557 RepID=UPI00325CEE67
MSEDPAPKTDFWAVMGIGHQDAHEENGQQQDPANHLGRRDAEEETAVASSAGQAPAGTALPPPEPAANDTSPPEQDAWAAMFSEENGAPPTGTEGPAQPGTAGTAVPTAKAPVHAAPGPEAAGQAGPAGPEAAGPDEPVPDGSAANDPAGTAAALPPDPTWVAAEQLEASIRPRLTQLWLQLLTEHAGGDAAMGRRIYQVMDGLHLMGELCEDQSISEVHVHGTRVTVVGPSGTREVPGFSSQATARRAIEAVKARRDAMRVTVTELDGSVVVRRAHNATPSAADLVASGILTEDLVSRVREALDRVQAVTITGPAARIVMRAFAPLVPEGSRVFAGPQAVLPPGCLAAAGPLDADYVIGVRPGVVAEEMAAAGQLGALIANPQTRFRAAVRLLVSGRSTAPGAVTIEGSPVIPA